MRNKKLFALALATTMVASLFTGCNNDNDSKNEQPTTTTQNNGPSVSENNNIYGLTENIEDGAILHCFSWSFNAISESLEDIAMAGFSAIQTSPINACYDGGDAGNELFGSGKWYYHYQPTDWTIGNYQLGTKEEFTAMCEKAHSYGIKVIVDVAPNHTTKQTDAISQNFLDAVGGLDNLYHSNGMSDISNYQDRKQCTLQAVGGLYDVNTENPDFQNYFINYLNDVIACGADGFRYDTAKHIGLSDDPQDDASLPNNFWDRVTTEVTNANSLFMYGEVLQDGGERIADYINKIGATTASSYGSSIRSCLVARNIVADTVSNLKIGNASPNVVTWVESHDNYTGDDATYKLLDNNKIKMGWCLITVRAEGTPLFFSRPYGATSDNMWGTFNKIGMVGDNLYKDPLVVASNRFRNAMTGLSEKLFNPDDNNCVLFVERGTKGLAIINNDTSDYTFEVSTNLENGDYTDRVDGTTTYTVKDGKITGTVKASNAVILYNDGYVDLKTPATVKVADDTNGSFTGDSIKVTLVAENSVKSSYSIDGGTATAFSNGDVITVGEGLNSSETTKLTLYGENEAGNKTCISYIFKKQDAITNGVKIYFEKPDDWGERISAYVYDETSYSETKQNSAWPGVAMEKEADGTYSYTFTEEWLAPLVIFTDGNKQSNGALEPGAAVIADKVYSID
ncbi:MAG: starch-binding protein [Lachnospiraceae bacterium]|nr:starch-binding protein [Lachnospiraceae bacterium]MDE6699019.1 starch-binding protein [Lachnospiraceae bacterium]